MGNQNQNPNAGEQQKQGGQSGQGSGQPGRQNRPDDDKNWTPSSGQGGQGGSR